MAMATIHRSTGSLFYEDLGAGDPPIVLVHGIGTHALFAHQIAHFRRCRRVIAPDLPGFGQSEAAPDRRYEIAEYADDIAWLCDELELRAPVIVGHSMGGAIAFEIAAARPDVPSAIVMIDPLPVVPLPALRQQRAALATALAGPNYCSAIRGFAERNMFRPTDDPDTRGRIVNDMCATPPRVLVPTFASINGWSGEHLAHRVRCPVLLITAGDGLPTDMTRTRQLVARLELGRGSTPF
jgi:pimeloyl-ACP methyl ester carboxylesterase